MTIKNKETLEKLRTYQIGVIRSVITSRQGRLGTYQADATDRERLADTDGLAYEEYYESPLTIEHDGLCRNVISLEFCEDGLTPVCLMDGWDGDDFPLPLENLSCDTLQGIVEWLEEYDFIPSAEAAPQTTSDLTEDFVERCLPEYHTRYDVSGWASCRTSSTDMNPRNSGWTAMKPPRSATVCSFGSMPRPSPPL